MAFTGFSPAAFAFFEGLAADNCKAYWQANKSVYDTEVKGAMQALLDDLGEFGPFNIFRPYNDLRFAKGRPPYKEAIGAVGERQGGSTYYVQLSATGLMIGCGYYDMASDQLERFRAAVDDPRSGEQVAAICTRMEKKGYGLGAMNELKTAPRGYAKDHPRVAILRRKGLTAFKSWPVEPSLHTKAVVKKVRDGWNGAGELNDWLDENVGPSTLPPPEFGR
jgi:uncharacterized protein (TIGR02453 family)